MNERDSTMGQWIVGALWLGFWFIPDSGQISLGLLGLAMGWAWDHWWLFAALGAWIGLSALYERRQQAQLKRQQVDWDSAMAEWRRQQERRAR